MVFEFKYKCFILVNEKFRTFYSVLSTVCVLWKMPYRENYFLIISIHSSSYFQQQSVQPSALNTTIFVLSTLTFSIHMGVYCNKLLSISCILFSVWLYIVDWMSSAVFYKNILMFTSKNQSTEVVTGVDLIDYHLF